MGDVSLTLREEGRQWIARALAARPQQPHDKVDARLMAAVLDDYVAVRDIPVERLVSWIEARELRPTIREVLDLFALQEGCK